MKNDFEFIKEKIENATLPKPEWLEEEDIKEKLKNVKQDKKHFTHTKAFKGIMGVAACLVIAILCLKMNLPTTQNAVAIHSSESSTQPVTQSTQGTQSTPASTSAITCFNDYDEVKQTMEQLITQNSNLQDSVKGNEVASEEVDGVIYEALDTASTASAGASSYAKTYNQVETVEEADIIKNDGKYIYYVQNNIIIIYSAVDGKTEVVSKIEDYSYENQEETNDDENFGFQYIEDIFLYNNRLIVNVSSDIYNNKIWRDYTETVIYDMSKIETPKKLKTFKQSGCYNSSRMIGQQLYLISTDGIQNVCKDLTSYVPCISEDDENTTAIAATDIAYVNDADESSYLVISSIDMDSCKKTTNTKAVLGGSSNIYCNENDLFITQTKYNDTNYTDKETTTSETTATTTQTQEDTTSNSEELADADIAIDSFRTAETEILKITLGKEDIQFTATAKVDGYLYSQFALDEQDGYLRVATTSKNKKGTDINNLYILDSNLELTGKVTGFAKNESIKAVRYIGDMAYVITYEETDPLFIIDLSNPKKPEITGQVKITGFSTLLVPIDENTLLGIGYNTEQGEEMEVVTNGIKFALFDISDSNHPKVITSEVVSDVESVVQDNYKALVVNRAEGYFAIPYEKYVQDTWSTGVLTFEVKDNKVQITNQLEAKNLDNSVVRCTYIDDYLYAIDYSGNITSFQIE
jgi:uncharacterized secreted protein with C-terminal beta-propeller domain